MLSNILEILSQIFSFDILIPVAIYGIFTFSLVLASGYLFSKEKFGSGFILMFLSSFLQSVALSFLIAWLIFVLFDIPDNNLNFLISNIFSILKASVIGVIFITLISAIPVVNIVMRNSIISEFIMGVVIFNLLTASIKDKYPILSLIQNPSLLETILIVIVWVIVGFGIAAVTALLFPFFVKDEEQFDTIYPIFAMISGSILSVFPLLAYIINIKLSSF
ncbi:hypothetical protein [Persephonella sp.]